VNLEPCPRCKQAAFDLNLTDHGLCQTCDVRLTEDRHYAVASIDRMLDTGLLTANQGQSLIDRVMGRKDSLTADGQRILIGNRYIDYDLRPTVVTGVNSISLDHREKDGAAIWWRTTTGMFDGTRLAHRRAA
jgi:hypothetical protein